MGFCELAKACADGIEDSYGYQNAEADGSFCQCCYWYLVAGSGVDKDCI